MPRPEQCHAVVLAAGRGTRMGTPKALMQTPAGPWWRVQTKKLAAVGVTQTWVVSPQVRAELDKFPDASTRSIIGDAAAPMFTSIHAGLCSLAEDLRDGVFVIPVDVPVPQPQVWQALCAAGALTVPTHHADHGHPVFLPAPWVKTTLADIDRHGIDPATLRLDTLIAPIVHYLEVPDPAVTTNLNTIADLQDFLNSSRA